MIGRYYNLSFEVEYSEFIKSTSEYFLIILRKPMDVEHQHHFDPPGKKEKAWKHYAIEFFMLFLAVSLGFFAENYRDQYIEKERAEEMAVGLYNDLVNDSIKIQAAIERDNLFINEMNSLITTLSDKDIKNIVTKLTYYQASFLMEIDMPVPSRANLDQLTNSGSLRYFKNRKSSHGDQPVGQYYFSEFPAEVRF